ncbi:MAG: hypothetical protein FJ078_00920 [Cyanobacteria bacterium K_DeepCast_35m_m2_155]|nr:hypothetical protein [Cyanobacteria bacterium K_DeepCast_35m_m2_155]
MLAFLALLPRVLVTFFYALAALLRFFVDGTTAAPNQAQASSALLGWSLAAFVLASAALLVDLGLEWDRGNDRRDRQVERRERQVYRLDRETRYSRAVAEVLLEPTDGNVRRLRELIAAEF